MQANAVYTATLQLNAGQGPNYLTYIGTEMSAWLTFRSIQINQEEDLSAAWQGAWQLWSATVISAQATAVQSDINIQSTEVQQMVAAWVTDQQNQDSAWVALVTGLTAAAQQVAGSAGRQCRPGRQPASGHHRQLHPGRRRRGADVDQHAG